MQNTYAALNKAVDESKNILLLTDQRSDGDTFGSSLAFGIYLRRIGKNVSHFATSPVLPIHSFLPGIENVSRDEEILQNQDIGLIIVFDSSREDAVRPLVGHIDAPLIVVDHHASNSRFGDINLIDIEASSTCEIVERYFRHQRIFIDPDMAKCLITGVMTDTGVLTNGTTKSDSFDAANRLMIDGGSVKRVVENVQKNASVEQLNLWGRVFERIVHAPRYGVAVTWVTNKDLEETSTTDEDISELSDYFSATLNVDAILFLKTRKEGIKVSMRSHGIDLLQLAQSFGGGGHPNSCGFTVHRARVVSRGGQPVVE
jgi:bifunctional oligoribonuclease and PAP phosphatase NrnA